MTWSSETSNGYEAQKIASIAVPYLQGRALDLGCGAMKAWPMMIGMDSGAVHGKGGADIAGDISDLSMFADASFDAVFSSHALEDFPRSMVPTVLAEWSRVVKIDGYLVLYVPSANLYPKVGEEGANPAHQWDIYPGDIEAILREQVEPPASHVATGWELVESEERGQGNEYSLFIVVRKTLRQGWHENLWQRNPDGKKRALVCRFGAIGDQIQTSSILPELRKQGYHITYCTTPKGQEVIRHDPHIEEWLIQETDFVPNEYLGPYFRALEERYDTFINLCESIEGALLALPGRPNHFYSHEARRLLYGGVNYLERMHDIAGVPHVFHPKFYPTKTEVARMRNWKHNTCGDAPVILWAIRGSSLAHKTWPYVQVVARWLVERSPCHVVLVSDGDVGKRLQDGIIDCLVRDGVDTSRVHGVAGEWSIRDTLTFAVMADCVVGPETGVLNAVGFEPNAKVIFLSHSSETQLTRDWVNTQAIKPHNTACYPCHQLHHDFSYCPEDKKTAVAKCSASIPPEEVFTAIARAFGAVKLAEAAD